MKLHVGCGSVYLKDWMNIDVRGPKTFLATDRPDLVDKWATFEDRYYAKHQDKTQDSLRAGPLDQEYVCDYFGDFGNLPAAAWSVDEILARHSFEHLSITEAHKALDAIDEVLKEGGVLRLDVPDHEASLKVFRETGDDFWIRHLLGPRRTDHGFHMMSYDRARLRALVEEHGFIFEKEESNIHFYPSFCLRFIKPGPRLPYEYVPIPDDHGRLIDIGPGQYPHPRARTYVEHDKLNCERLRDIGKQVIQSDILSGLEEIPTKYYDYAWCSHMLEHVSDPVRACKVISRIAKRGVIIMPSAWKESLTNFEEATHIWQVLPHPSGGAPIFIRTGAQADQLRNQDTMKILSRSFRTGPNGRVTDEGRHLRRWWYEREPQLDVVYHWQNSLEVTVIG